VDLGALPRQHRRRREKKLMTIDDVNEKFPLTKYKTWRSTRAEEGLPTAGGITATTASRPASIREPRDSKEANTEELVHLNTVSTTDEKPMEGHGKLEDIAQPAEPSSPRPKTDQSSHNPPDSPVKPTMANDDDDDDHIQTAVPAEQLPDPGDACAICIDTIEDDDDVRGLHCGHAFHASCVDPWLTSRRACCPLCKADYYVPKPRLEGQESENGRRGTGGDGVQMPAGAFFLPGGRRPTMVLPGRFMSIVYDDRDRHGFPRVVREPRPSRSERRRQERERQISTATTVNAEGQTEEHPQPTGWRQRLRNVVPTISGLRAHPPSSQAANTAASPGQLEAGTGRAQL
jgi:Ring finger domain